MKPQKKSHLLQIDPDTIDWRTKDEQFWKEVLTPEQYHVAREGGTEMPFSGEYNKENRPGVYVCSSCGLPLFDSKDKYDSGTGWPSFNKPISPQATKLTPESRGALEVSCPRCGAHLGHVFDDGPKPTGKRYCMNSVCLLFKNRP